MNFIKKLIVFTGLITSAISLLPSSSTTGNNPYNATMNAAKDGKLGATGPATSQNTGTNTTPPPKTSQKPPASGKTPATPPTNLGANFPLFVSLPISGTNGEIGQYYPLLKFAWLKNPQGDTLYYLNSTPTAPNEASAHLYTQNFASITLSGQKISLHGIEITPTVKNAIYEWYGWALDTILPYIIDSNISEISTKTLGNLWTAGSKELTNILLKTYYPNTKLPAVIE